MKKLFLLISIILIISLMLSCNPKLTPNEEHNNMLRELGIDVDGISDLTDPDGDPLPEGYNPLKKKIGVFNPRREIYQVGYYINDIYQGLYEDSDELDSMLDDWTGDDTWALLPTRCDHGDLDGDGFDEVAIVVYNTNDDTLNLRVIDDKSTDYQKFEFTINDNVVIGDNPYMLNKVDITTGDIDGDVIEEVLVTFIDNVYIIKKAGSNFSVLYTMSYTKPSSYSNMWLNTAAGDIDSDFVDEVVVTEGYRNFGSSGKYYIYDEDFNNPLDTGYVNSQDLPGDPVNITIPTVTIGDYDNDGLGEIIFAGTNVDNEIMIDVLVMNDAKGYGNVFGDELEFTNIVGHYEEGDILPPTIKIPLVRLLDVDGDGKLEIATPTALFDDIDELDGDNHMSLISSGYGNIINGNDRILAVGDVNNDRKEDIITSSSNISVHGFDSSSQFVEHFSQGASDWYPDVCCPNIDNDTAVLRYRNEHELLFTDPQIHAVLASPPYWSQYDQALVSSETSFGIMHSQGQSYTDEFGFSVGFSLGYYQETPLWGSAGSAEFKMTVENSFNWSSTHTHTIEETYSYITPAGEDMVVFSAVPFDVYYYDIISAPDGADECVGDVMTINIPRDIMTTACEKDFYNQHNGECTDVDVSVLVHSIGEPFSYMTTGEKETLVLENSSNVLYSNMMLTVGAGSGYQQIEITETSEQSSGFSYDLNITAEFETVSGGVLVGASAGFHYGHSMETTIGESTIIAGTVGNLSSNDYTVDRAFSWGLISYPFNFEDGYEINIITYWTE